MVEVTQLGNDSLTLELKEGDRVEIVEEGDTPLFYGGERGTVLDVGPTKRLDEGSLFLDLEGWIGPKHLVGAEQVRLVEVRGMSEEEKRSWEKKSKEGKLKVIERIVSEAREAKEERPPVRILGEKLKKLKEAGCTIDVQSHGGYEYLRASKSVGGTTKTKILGRPDAEWGKACKLAGVHIRWKGVD
ncbi:hypothetical protein AKJ41_03645 [candidate division MSBL1 archaeon SCGC-AAA259O05]|uniref:Uncharacterized protein n=1 Tax=candidate division MSBL1 archaeon SCGC-AAA259O05 TaxID=1698271 RepID=A0A133V306_9EURY|nr:hypothetical protein AKJ41_03645 [candidate division MSBL1 archaeon SCGC-AAA259O05]